MLTALHMVKDICGLFRDRAGGTLVADAQKVGDPARGSRLYETKLAACAACHAIGGKGGALGPDLSGIGRGLTPDLIVESVLWPRRQVKEGFLSVSVSTRAGDEFSGYAVAEDGTELRLRDVATGTVQRIPKASIAKRTTAGTIMPEGMTAGLNRQELVDLMAGQVAAVTALLNREPPVWKPVLNFTPDRAATFGTSRAPHRRAASALAVVPWYR